MSKFSDILRSRKKSKGPLLDNQRVAFVATDGVEQIELIESWKAVENAGAEAELVSPKEDVVQGVEHLDRGQRFKVDRTIKTANANEYDALVIPGGVTNPDSLRMNDDALRFIKDFFEQGKPVGVICHGPWTLVETGLVEGRTITSWPSLHTDITNAGGNWVDKEVVTDHGLVSSRSPKDLTAFCNKIVEEFAEGTHEEQAGRAAR